MGAYLALHSFPTRRSSDLANNQQERALDQWLHREGFENFAVVGASPDLTHHEAGRGFEDRKSTRLNSSHVEISYAVFCLKKKKNADFYQYICVPEYGTSMC